MRSCYLALTLCEDISRPGQVLGEGSEAPQVQDLRRRHSQDWAGVLARPERGISLNCVPILLQTPCFETLEQGGPLRAGTGLGSTISIPCPCPQVHSGLPAGGRGFWRVLAGLGVTRGRLASLSCRLGPRTGQGGVRGRVQSLRGLHLRLPSATELSMPG